jgi:hypothetical protein
MASMADGIGLLREAQRLHGGPPSSRLHEKITAVEEVSAAIKALIDQLGQLVTGVTLDCEHIMGTVGDNVNDEQNVVRTLVEALSETEVAVSPLGDLTYRHERRLRAMGRETQKLLARRTILEQQIAATLTAAKTFGHSLDEVWAAGDKADETHDQINRTIDAYRRVAGDPNLQA